MIDHNVQNLNIDMLRAVKVNKLQDIIKLEAGASHFLALKQKVRPPLIEWTVEMLIEWLPTAGFGECANVFKFGKISGQKLVEKLSKQFIEETMGIIGENE